MKSRYLFPAYVISKAVKWLLIINSLVFLGLKIFPSLLFVLGLNPVLAVKHLMIFQLVSYLFVHPDIWHFIINMLMLYFFGVRLEQAWGRKFFLKYYLGAGVISGLIIVIFSGLRPILVWGASSSIFALLIAMALVYPEDQLIIYFVPVPMKVGVAILIIIQLFILFSYGSIIAWLQLSGGLIGYLILKREQLVLRLQHRSWFSSYFNRLKNSKEKRIHQDKKKIDLLLDKISSSGWDSLTQEEKRFLRQKSKGK